MKKFLYYFSILALVAGFASSCNKDDDGDDSNGSSIVKRLVKTMESDGGYDMLEYDDQGRCISYKNFDKDGKMWSQYSFSYEDNKIIVEGNSSGCSKYTETSTLNSNGFIVLREGQAEISYGGAQTWEYKYEYDNLGQLTTEYYTNSASSETSIKKYIWENGNIIKYTSGNEWAEFKYTNKNHSSPVVNITKFSASYQGDVYPLYSKLGVPCKNLIVGGRDNFDTDGSITEYDIKWELDSDGYPIKNIDDDGYYVSYVWE